MLITWMDEDQKSAFGLGDYGPFEVVVAVHRRLHKVLGYAAFSRDDKEIKAMEVFDQKRGETVKEKLKLVVSRQLDPVSGSFHSLYPKFASKTLEAGCPICKADPMGDTMEDIAELDYSYVSSDSVAQGALYGKLIVIAKRHNVHFYDLPDRDMMHFMGDIKKTARALHEVSGAVKINYEIHGNSTPHLHCHLFPRYLDDGFPGISIDYQKTEPSPYETADDYRFFIDQMRRKLEKADGSSQ